MKLRTALASLAMGTWIIVAGSLADFGDTYSRTAFALGVSVPVVGFILAGWILEGGRRR